MACKIEPPRQSPQSPRSNSPEPDNERLIQIWWQVHDNGLLQETFNSLREVSEEEEVSGLGETRAFFLICVVFKMNGHLKTTLLGGFHLNPIMRTSRTCALKRKLSNLSYFHPHYPMPNFHPHYPIPNSPSVWNLRRNPIDSQNDKFAIQITKKGLKLSSIIENELRDISILKIEFSWPKNGYFLKKNDDSDNTHQHTRWLLATRGGNTYHKMSSLGVWNMGNSSPPAV